MSCPALVSWWRPRLSGDWPAWAWAVRRSAGVLSAVVILATALGGCGGGGGGPSDPGSGGTADPTDWRPADGAAPPTGNVVLLASEAGEFVGQGETRLYTLDDAFVRVGSFDTALLVRVDGLDGRYGTGDFLLPSPAVRIEPGVYRALDRARLQWSGNHRGCNLVIGWLAVDRAVYVHDTLVELEMRFGQQCEGVGPWLHGFVRWKAADWAAVWGPLDPLWQRWQPPAGSTPASGDYLFLQGEPDDLVGLGQRVVLASPADRVSIRPSGRRLSFRVPGAEPWTGEIELPDTVSRWTPGHYERLESDPTHAKARGGIGWQRGTRVCLGGGWVVVDRARYEGDRLAELALRFERKCGAFALRGQLVWTAPPGPVDPAPADLWVPADPLPDAPVLAHFDSDADDPVGQGVRQTLLPEDLPAPGAIEVLATGAALDVRVAVGSDTAWFLAFQAMDGLERLEPGYYGALRRESVADPRTGWLSAVSGTRSCEDSTGWLAIDEVRYEGEVLAAIDLRFGQVCGGATGALHGRIRWVR